jgi:Mrp family chromosome partitioning ATPase
MKPRMGECRVPVPPRVFLCCPDPPAASIARVIVEAGGEIVGTEAVLDGLLSQNLDCDILALADITPGGLSVAEAVGRVRARDPRVRVILLLSEDNPVLTGEAMKAGVYDWTVDEALETELPVLLHRPRSYADVVGHGAPPASKPAEFASGSVHRIALGFNAQYSKAVEALLERGHAGEYTVGVRAETFEDLIRSVTSEFAGIVTGANQPSIGGFDLVTRARLLTSAARGAEIVMLLLPSDPEGVDEELRGMGVITVRGRPTDNRKVAYPATTFDEWFARMERAVHRKASVAASASVARPEPQRGIAPVYVASERDARFAAGEQVVSVAVPSRVVGVFSAATSVGKTSVALFLAVLAGRLGISSLLLDFSTLPPGNAALRLGIPLSSQPGLEALLQGDWDDDLYMRLKLRFADTQMYTLRPISEQVLGTLHDTRPKAFERLIEFSRGRYALTVVDTSPVLDDESVLAALDRSDKALYVVDATDDRVEQSVARLAWVLHAMPDPSRLSIVINKVGPGGWAPQDILDRLKMPDVKAFVLPNEEVRHRRSLMSHRPIAMDVGPNDPWARMFASVAGDLVSLDRRRRWVDRPVPRTAAKSPDAPAAQGADAVERQGALASVLRWLGSSSTKAQL